MIQAASGLMIANLYEIPIERLDATGGGVMAEYGPTDEPLSARAQEYLRQSTSEYGRMDEELFACAEQYINGRRDPEFMGAFGQLAATASLLHGMEQQEIIQWSLNVANEWRTGPKTVKYGPVPRKYRDKVDWTAPHQEAPSDR
jgi:hypothetical protein